MKKNEKDIRVLKEDKYTYEGKSSNGSELKIKQWIGTNEVFLYKV